MAELTRAAAFDARLERVLIAYGDTAVGPIDALAIAERAILLERRRANRRPWTWLAAAAVVTLLALLAVVALGSGGRSVFDWFGPSPTPAATKLVIGSVPPALQGRWMGSPRTIGPFEASAGTYLAIDGQRLCVSGRSYNQACTVLLSAATVLGPGALRLSASVGGLGCVVGAIGTYRWSVSPGGGILTIEGVADPCGARAEGIVGTWYRSDCRDVTDACLGLLEAGRYPSQFLHPKGPTAFPASDFGAIEYTVPDGWANSGDWPVLLSLTPAADYANETDQGAVAGSYHELDVLAHPLPANRNATCGLVADSQLPNPTAAAFAGWLNERPDLVVADRGAVTIDGQAGLALDITRRADVPSVCSGGGAPRSDYLVLRDDTGGGFAPSLYDREVQRLLLVNLGTGELLAVLIDSSDPARFDDLVAASMPIVNSLVIR